MNKTEFDIIQRLIDIPNHKLIYAIRKVIAEYLKDSKDVEDLY